MNRLAALVIGALLACAGASFFLEVEDTIVRAPSAIVNAETDTQSWVVSDDNPLIGDADVSGVLTFTTSDTTLTGSSTATFSIEGTDVGGCN